MKKKLAIICANLEQLPLVEKAKEMGIETHCFSWDKGDTSCKGIADYFHPISILEKEQILEKCREIEIDGVVVINNDYAVPTVAFVAQNMGLPGNRYEDMIMAAGNKYTMRQALHKHKVKSPRFAIAHEGVDLSEFKYPLIVKATDRCASLGIVKVEKEQDLWEAIRQAQELSFKKEVIIEEFISGSETGVDAISYNGEHHILALIEREMIFENNLPKRVAKHFPFELPADIHDKIIIETKKALDAINFKNGPSNTEFKITDAGEVFVLETSPLTCTSPLLMKLYNGYDFLEGLIHVALGQFEKPVFTQKKYSGDYVCRQGMDNIRQAIENKENDPDIIEAVLYNEGKNNLGRIGYFIYQSDHKRRWNVK